MAAMAEAFGVKTAWHGPGDVSPVGHMANVTLSLVCWNFGVQEFSPFNERHQEIFSGCPVLKNGYAYANEAPGWGIEVNEKAAAKYHWSSPTPTISQRPGGGGRRSELNGGWGVVRRRDGTVIKQ
jgi:mannonate dehydratase